MILYLTHPAQLEAVASDRTISLHPSLLRPAFLDMQRVDQERKRQRAQTNDALRHLTPARCFLRDRLVIARLRRDDPIAYANVCCHIRRHWAAREKGIAK